MGGGRGPKQNMTLSDIFPHSMRLHGNGSLFSIKQQIHDSHPCLLFQSHSETSRLAAGCPHTYSVRSRRTVAGGSCMVSGWCSTNAGWTSRPVVSRTSNSTPPAPWRDPCT